MTTIYAHRLLYLREGRPQRIATNQRWLDHRRVRRFFQGYHPQKWRNQQGGRIDRSRSGTGPQLPATLLFVFVGRPTFWPKALFYVVLVNLLHEKFEIHEEKRVIVEIGMLSGNIFFTSAPPHFGEMAEGIPNHLAVKIVATLSLSS